MINTITFILIITLAGVISGLIDLAWLVPVVCFSLVMIVYTLLEELK